MRFVVKIVFLVLWAQVTLASSDLVIHTTPVNPQHADLHEILIKSYERLNVPVIFTTLPYTRGSVSANYGVIDGLDLRLESHAADYTNLVKVEYPVYVSNIVLVIDKQLCINCSSMAISSIASVSGYNFQSHFKQDVLTDLSSLEFADHAKLFRFFDGRRVEGMVVGDIFLPQKYIDNPRYQIVRLTSQKVFHYLHEKHAGLAKKLAHNFERLNEVIARELKTGASNLGQSLQAPPAMRTNVVLNIQAEVN
ncbi:hypothetical protein [Agaribacter marinus]|uniref:Transporter substrate-binding domain-containing protein n=1 Tax=Agaribacter marinus TaxID=1431249 RepID=A0AA37T5G9_9ALTE|nr:hypothetical protein [Agaribacter marinus]GLR71860.1 hypothetical protein GCM10007852_27680 [Agaribacter marinus]